MSNYAQKVEAQGMQNKSDNMRNKENSSGRGRVNFRERGRGNIAPRGGH